jgi:ATP-binding cassette subfamily B protein
VVIFCGIGTSLATPYLSQIAIDNYLLNTNLTFNQRVEGLLFIILLFFIVYIANYPIGYAQTYLTTLIGRKIEYDLRMDLFSHLQNLSLNYFDEREVGRIMSRVTNDVDNLTELLTSGIITALADVLTLGGIIVIMLYLNIYLSLISFTIIPFMVLFVLTFGKKARKNYRRTRKTISGVTSHIEQSVSGMKEIQAYSKEKVNMDNFKKANVMHFDANISAAKIQSTFFPVVGFFAVAGLTLVLWVGGSSSITNPMQMPWGILYAFMQYLNRFFFPIQSLSMFYNNIQSALSGAERTVDLLDTQVEVKETEKAIRLPPIEGAVKFENVFFSYKSEVQVLKNINFKVKPNENIAIVGPTGAGKTTLINLIYRFYDPQQGEVTLDKHPLPEVTLKSLRSQMAIVLQDPFLFSGTIKDNILIGNPEADDEKVVKEAKAVGIHDFIANLPEGYNTEVGERGGRLSMGQRQLISFARALISNPRILILDEATSSVDAYTELLIQKALQKIQKGRTSFIIAHRLSTVRNADRIIVLNHGKIVEEGNHLQLMKREGLYRRLYEMQFRTNKANDPS